MTQDRTQEPSPAIDVPEADALEQQREIDAIPETIPMDVPEADALEQARDAELDEEGRLP